MQQLINSIYIVIYNVPSICAHNIGAYVDRCVYLIGNFLVQAAILRGRPVLLLLLLSSSNVLVAGRDEAEGEWLADGIRGRGEI